MPRGTNAPKLCPAEPVRWMSIVSSGRPVAAPALGELVAEHRADGAVDVADRQLDARTGCAVVERRPAARDQLAGRAPGRGRGPAPPTAVQRLAVRVAAGTARIGDEVEARAPSSGRSPPRVSSTSTWPIASAIDAEAELGQQLAHLLGDELEEVHDELGLAGEPLAQLGVLRGDADRAGVEVADAHHHAAATRRAARWRSRTPRRRAARRSTTSRPVFSWPSVCTTMRSRRPLSSSVCCVSARPSSHGAPACLSDVSGAGAGAAVVAGDEHDVGLGLATRRRRPCRPDLGDELHVHARRRVGVLEVVDELLEVLDRVDVVVRRRADEARRPAWSAGSWRSTGTPCGPGSWPPSPGLAPWAILICRSSALTRYSRRDAEAARRDLLDRRAPRSPLVVAERSASSPPSPVFDLPPMRFIAMASVSWASAEIEP